MLKASGDESHVERDCSQLSMVQECKHGGGNHHSQTTVHKWNVEINILIVLW